MVYKQVALTALCFLPLGTKAVISARLNTGGGFNPFTSDSQTFQSMVSKPGLFVSIERVGGGGGVCVLFEALPYISDFRRCGDNVRRQFAIIVR